MNKINISTLILKSHRRYWFGLLLIWGVSCNTAWGRDIALKLEGPLTQGGLVKGKTDPRSKVFFDDQSVRVSKQGVFLIGFGRDAKPQARLKVMLPNGAEQTRELKITQRQYHIQHIKGLPARQVSPSGADLARIHQEAAMVKETRSLDDVRTDFLKGFIWPVHGPITGIYGSQRILNGQPRTPHYGVDIAAPVGTLVHAPADGVVTLAHSNMLLSGGTLIIDHGHGLSSTFIHLSRILVKKRGSGATRKTHR